MSLPKENTVSDFVKELKEIVKLAREEKKRQVWEWIPFLVKGIKESAKKRAMEGHYKGSYMPKNCGWLEIPLHTDRYLLEPFLEELQSRLPEGLRIEKVTDTYGFYYEF